MQQCQIDKLRELTRDYRTYDNELRQLNTRVYETRDARKGVELLMVDILKEDQFKDFNKLKIEDDGSTIRIQRPRTWSKPWSISQKELKAMLDSYFSSSGNTSSTDCYNYIIANKKSTLLSDEFAITRIVPE
jgi:hypothetical protein